MKPWSDAKPNAWQNQTAGITGPPTGGVPYKRPNVLTYHRVADEDLRPVPYFSSKDFHFAAITLDYIHEVLPNPPVADSIASNLFSPWRRKFDKGIPVDLGLNKPVFQHNFKFYNARC